MSDKNLMKIDAPDLTKEIKEVANSLLITVKTCSLYPENHINFKQSIERFHRTLLSFLEMYGELRFNVGKDRLLYEDYVIHEGPAKETNLAFSLFRDGIREIGFRQNVELWEIQTLIKILNQYKTLPAEAEEDLVTALWDARLPHIFYDAVDFYLMSDFKADTVLPGFTHKRSKENKREAKSDPEGLKQKPMMAQISYQLSGSSPKKIPAPQLQHNLWFQLTEEETASIADMVAREEALDSTQEMLNMLVDVLRHEENEELINAVLIFLKEEFRKALTEKHFEVALKILRGLHFVHGFNEKERPVETERIQAFFVWAASSKGLEPLHTIWKAENYDQHLDKIAQVLVLLPPAAVITLGPTLSGARFKVQRMLIKVIMTLANRDLGPIQRLLSSSTDNDVVRMLTGAVGHIKGIEAIRILFRMTRHQAKSVRKEALRYLIKRKVWEPDQFLSLVDDESNVIRQVVLRYLGSRKCEKTEQLFINYIQKQQKVHSGNQEHLSACFKTLGQCGSAHSIPFLRETIWSGNWFSRFIGVNSVKRQGAAFSLQTLGTEEAQNVLDEAASSFYPGVRRAVKEVMTTKHASREKPCP
jgi:hypothetical protein